jgi:hypothetical protein
MNPPFEHREVTMRRAIFVALSTGAVITSAAALSIGAAGNGDTSLSRAEYERALRAVEARRADLGARCETLTGSDREICLTEVASREMVQVAEIEAHYRRSESSARALQRARIDARHQVDRARCGAQSGIRRDRCLILAHATKGRALLEAAAPYDVSYRP